MKSLVVSKKGITFAPEKIKTVVLAQLVRASDCGSEGRGFEPHYSPLILNGWIEGWFLGNSKSWSFFIYKLYVFFR